MKYVFKFLDKLLGSLLVIALATAICPAIAICVFLAFLWDFKIHRSIFLDFNQLPKDTISAFRLRISFIDICEYIANNPNSK